MSILAFDKLLLQIDQFIRKFYRNQIIKGVIWFAGIFIITFILITTLEYFGRFNTPVRAVLFLSFILGNSFILIKFILIPILKLFSFGKRIDRYQASHIIGVFFPTISDRLLNTLQLSDDLSSHTGNIELLRASVQQRSEHLSVVPFSEAINLKENFKYLKLVIPAFLLMLFIAIVFPKLFIDGSNRVINYSTEFIPEAPFQFNLQEYTNNIIEGNDIQIELKLSGDDLPNNVYLISPLGKQLMTPSARNTFTAIIPKVRESGSFYFEANSFFSDKYPYSIYGVPTLGQFTAELIYPKYIGKNNETIINAGDLIIPEGTIINWKGNPKNTESINFIIGDKETKFKNGFKIQHKFIHSLPVLISFNGIQQNAVDSIKFNVNVIKDEFPSIQVEEEMDSLASGKRFFSGRIGDDYGLSGLNFVYTITSRDLKKRKEIIKVKQVSGLSDEFTFGVDFLREDIQLDDKIEYYFTVSDNDGVNGSKTTKSKLFVYKLPSLEELNENRELTQEQGKENLSKLLNQSEKFLKELEKLQKDLLNSKSNTWNQKNQLEALKKQHTDLLKSISETNKMLQNSTEEKQKFSKEDLQILEKQALIDELLEKLMDNDLMKLIDELQKLLEQNNKEGQQKTLDDLKLSTEDMNKQLDRSLEMLKIQQVDEKIDAIEEELKNLAKEQEALKEEISQKKLDKTESQKNQEDINDKFNQIKDDLKKLEELNKDLNRPMDLPSTEDKQNAIDNDLNDAQSNLSKGKAGKAGESQQSAAEQMKKLAEQMDEAQQESNKEQQGEDMELLRSILKSLVTLSFDQEDLMAKFIKINPNDPSFRAYGRTQRNIIDKTQAVRDSLYELAKRQPMISSFIDGELTSIKSSHKQALENVQEKNVRQLTANQQTAMTSYNNLALLLNESLQQMQQQMQAMMKGSGTCENPGGKGKPSSGEGAIGNMKEQLKKQLEQMKKGSNPGGKEGGSAPGNSPGSSEGYGLGNKEIAKMAAEQSAIRQKLEELRNELNKEGQGEGNQLNPLIKELEKQEEDLINKRFSNDLMKRQEDILTRLLESEKALRERGFEEKRESTTGKNEIKSNLIRFDEYNKEKLKQIELLKTIDPSYNKYYKDKANQYFNSVK